MFSLLRKSKMAGSLAAGCLGLLLTLSPIPSVQAKQRARGKGAGGGKVVPLSQAERRRLADELIEVAAKLFVVKDFRAAHMKCSAAVKLDENYGRSWMAMGMCDSREGNYYGAAEALWRARERDSSPAVKEQAAKELERIGFPRDRPLVPPTPMPPFVTVSSKDNPFNSFNTPEVHAQDDQELLLPLAETMDLLGWTKEYDGETKEIIWKRKDVVIRHKIGNADFSRQRSADGDVETVAFDKATLEIHHKGGDTAYGTFDFFKKVTGADVHLDPSGGIIVLEAAKR